MVSATLTWRMQLASGVVYVNKVTKERQEDKGREREMENPCRYVKPPGSVAWRREDKKDGDWRSL